MTVACPYCRAEVAVDAAGTSACGHLRGLPAEPAPPASPAPPVSPPMWGTPAAPQHGWPPAQRSGGGCRRGCGCVAALVVLAFVGLVLLLVLGGGQFSFQVGDSSDSPSPTGGQLPPAASPLTGTITRGPTTGVVKRTTTAGTATTVTAPAGGPLAGLEISVPKPAYAKPTTFAVSTTPLKVSGYGGAVTPISDVVTVSNGGAYAAAPITVTVPARVPDGAFAMGFYLLADGSLEPMPLLAETSTSVTVATRHFSSFFIASIAESALPANIGTGFRAGEDDFQTPNYGSAVAPGGHCAGQSLAEMWYFEERTSHGAPQLYGRYDGDGVTRTPGFWQDDRTVYRLASSVQEDLNWDTLSATLEWKLEKAKADRLQWDAFRYAMYVTGMPQFVGLSQSGASGGHAIVAYAATPHGLWVADPNFPGKLRDIPWNAAKGAFDPYLSGANAKSSKHAYDRIAFYGKTAYVEWSAIGARWAQVDSGSIGDDRFPDGILMVQVPDAAGKPTLEPLVSGMTLSSDTVTLRLDAADSSEDLMVTLYRDQAKVANVTVGTPTTVKLGLGINDLGVYLQAGRGQFYEAADFRHIRVTTPGPSMSILPSPSATPTPAPRRTPVPSPTFDCSVQPSGQIANVLWSLHCQGIGP